MKVRALSNDSAIVGPDKESYVNLRADRLVTAIAKLDRAIQAGDCQPIRQELDALAQLCLEQGLLTEALRIRRWLGDRS